MAINKTFLEEKYIFIFGARTSTFDGISNCTQYNSTIGGNAKYYPKDYMDDVNETWWMKTIRELDLKLCVNNSWSGSCVSTMIDNRIKCMIAALQ